MGVRDPKNITPVDRHVSGRVLQRRKALGLTQVQFGEKLGLTAGQIIKYEKSRDRLYAAGLWKMSQVLEVPVSHFFDGLIESADQKIVSENLAGTEFLMLRLWCAFNSAADPERKNIILEMAEDLKQGLQKASGPDETENSPSVKTPDIIDVYIGSRIRMRRHMLGLSQQGLSDQTGVSFQQIQKYERGLNSLHSTRLFQIAEALQIGVDYLYEGMELVSPCNTDNTQLIKDQQALLEAFHLITDGKMKEMFVLLVEGQAQRHAPEFENH